MKRILFSRIKSYRMTNELITQFIINYLINFNNESIILIISTIVKDITQFLRNSI